jgi:hypothetical protein
LKTQPTTANEDGDVLPQDTLGKPNYQGLEIPHLSIEERGGILLGFLECPVVYRQMVAQGKTPRQLADLKKEVLLWKEAGYPDPKDWPLSLLCLSELGLADK